MKIYEFIDSECSRFEHLDNKSKAVSLLESVELEMKATGNINIQDIFEAANDTIATCNFINQSKYNLELSVVKFLLEHYIQTNSFEGLTIPIPYTEKDNKRYNEIKKYLKNKFNQN